MPNRKVMEAAAENRSKMRPQAKRAYRKYGARVHELIRQLAGPTQADHDLAFDRLARMGEFVASELLQALADPTLDPPRPMRSSLSWEAPAMSGRVNRCGSFSRPTRATRNESPPPH